MGELLYDPDAEANLLACAFGDRDTFMLDVAPADFHSERLGRMWAAGQELTRSGVYPCSEEIRDWLTGQGFAFPEIEYTQIVARDVYAGNAPIWAAKVVELARKRAALELLEKSFGDAAGALANGNGTAFAEMSGIIAALNAKLRRDTVPADPQADLSHCPPLPESARLDAALAAGASPWLDAYIGYSQQWAPRAHPNFHESVALFVLSTIAARRVAVELGGKRHTNLYLANVARSSVWTKSTAHNLGAEVIEAAGLAHLLAPDDSTPQALLRRMGRQTVENWDTLTVDEQARAVNRIAFAGQRGWSFDEFGHKVAAMMRDTGPMADFRGILRKLDDCPSSYEYLTISHGSILLDRPYLALLGSMTPADMAPFAKRGGPLWSDGFWARFAFVAPAPDETPGTGQFPAGQRIIPGTILIPLREWHSALGAPSIDVVERVANDESGKARGKGWDVVVGQAPVQVCTLGAGVFEAYYRYFNALVALLEGNENSDLDGNYCRFADKALRVAALLGSFENAGLIELRHWARAQAIAERWRQSLHNLYATLNSALNDEGQEEERVLAVVHRLGTATPVQVKRYLPDLATSRVAAILERLTRAGALRVLEHTHKGTPRYAE